MDEETFNIINKISEEHCKKEFGYLKKEDIKGEIWVICLEKLKDYTKDKGELEHFLRVTVRNRLINRFKDITKSVRLPCLRCEYYNASKKVSCEKFGENKDLCEKWQNYQKSVESRNDLLNAKEQQKDQSSSENIINKVFGKEVKEKIYQNIDKKFLGDFNLFLDDVQLSKQRLRKLKEEIDRILKTEETLVQLTIRGKDGKGKK